MKKTVQSVTLICDRNGEPEKYKDYYFSDVVFTDGDKGIHAHRTELSDLFVEGVETEYNWDVKKNKQGIEYNSLKAPGSKKPYGGGGGGSKWVPKTSREQKMDAVSFASKQVSDMVIAKTIELEAYGPTLSTIITAIKTEIDLAAKDQ